MHTSADLHSWYLYYRISIHKTVFSHVKDRMLHQRMPFQIAVDQSKGHHLLFVSYLKLDNHRALNPNQSIILPKNTSGFQQTLPGHLNGIKGSKSMMPNSTEKKRALFARCILPNRRCIRRRGIWLTMPYRLRSRQKPHHPAMALRLHPPQCRPRI